jgi:hypothetical protein
MSSQSDTARRRGAISTQQFVEGVTAASGGRRRARHRRLRRARKD